MRSPAGLPDLYDRLEEMRRSGATAAEAEVDMRKRVATEVALLHYMNHFRACRRTPAEWRERDPRSAPGLSTLMAAWAALPAGDSGGPAGVWLTGPGADLVMDALEARDSCKAAPSERRKRPVRVCLYGGRPVVLLRGLEPGSRCWSAAIEIALSVTEPTPHGSARRRRIPFRAKVVASSAHPPAAELRSKFREVRVRGGGRGCNRGCVPRK